MKTNKNCFQSQSLNDWLFYLEQQHPSEIELGLARVKQVAQQGDLLNLSSGKTVLVAGTNGKGTTIAFMEQYLLSLGFSVGVYSSPHMFTYHERVRITGQHLSDQDHISAFSYIEHQRNDTPLTYFEFGTLAGFKLLQQANLDFVLVEVGLGGRLDATNIINHDLAIVTSIGLDHVDWLGDDLNTIAFEKAGIFRSGKPAVVGEPENYPAFEQQAKDHNVSKLMQLSQDYQYEITDSAWQYKSKPHTFSDLSIPLIPIQNVSTAITVLSQLDIELSASKINRVLEKVSLTGRMHILNDAPMAMVDVAHNSHAINYLLTTIAKSTRFSHVKEIHLVIAMMKDKDIKQSLELFQGAVTHWYLGNLPDNPRAAKTDDLAAELRVMGEKNVHILGSVKDAWLSGRENQTESSLLLGVGSFYTVAEILELEEVKCD